MKFIHKYGSLILLLCRIAIIIAVPFLVADALSSHSIINAISVKYYDGGLYGIDLHERAQYLFSYDIDKKQGRITRTDSIADMAFSDSGDAYLLKKSGENAEILKWDYGKASLETVTQAAFVEGMEPARIYASESGLFYIYYIDEPGKEIQRFAYNDEWQPVGSAVLYPCEGFDLQNAKPVDSGELFFLSQNQSLYRSVEKADPELIFDVNSGPEENTAYTNYYCTSQEVRFTNSISGNTYAISLVGTDRTPVLSSKTYKSAETFDDLRLHNARYTGGTVKAGCLNIEDGRKIAAVCGDVETAVDSIEWSTLQYVVVLLLVAAALVLLMLILRKQIDRLEKAMLSTDITVLISVTVILMIICAIASSIASVDYLKRYQLEQTSKYSLELANSVTAQLAQLDVAEMAETGETPLADVYAEYGILLKFYTVKNGQVCDTGAAVNNELPVDQYDSGLSVSLQNSISGTVQTGSISQAVFQLYQTKYAGTVVPLGDLFGESSVMVVAMPIKEFWKAFTGSIVLFATIFMITQLVAFAVILIILHKLERQLAGLMDASARVLAGELGAKADGSGINEVAATIRVFNRMSENLKKDDLAFTNCEIVTKSFTPLGLMRQINGGFGDNVISVGSSVEGKAQILGVLLEGNKMDLSDEEKEEYFAIIDEFVNHLSHLGGSLMDVTWFSLRYIDAGMTNDLFRTVSALLRKFNTSGKIRIRAAISITDIKTTVVGTEDYMVLDAYETRPSGTKELIEEAAQKGISLLLTDYAAKTAGFSKYHFRKAGVFHSTPTGMGELLYEAIDACSQSDARARWDTRAIYEKGLRNLYLGKVKEARRAMAEVLISDNNDTVARYYIKMCNVGETSEETLTETVETAPEAAPEAAPETAPEAALEAALETTPEATPEAVPEATPETASEGTSEGTDI